MSSSEGEIIEKTFITTIALIHSPKYKNRFFSKNDGIESSKFNESNESEESTIKFKNITTRKRQILETKSLNSRDFDDFNESAEEFRKAPSRKHKTVRKKKRLTLKRIIDTISSNSSGVFEREKYKRKNIGVKRLGQKLSSASSNTLPELYVERERKSKPRSTTSFSDLFSDESQEELSIDPKEQASIIFADNITEKEQNVKIEKTDNKSVKTVSLGIQEDPDCVFRTADDDDSDRTEVNFMKERNVSTPKLRKAVKKIMPNENEELHLNFPETNVELTRKEKAVRKWDETEVISLSSARSMIRKSELENEPVIIENNNDDSDNDGVHIQISHLEHTSKRQKTDNFIINSWVKTGDPEGDKAARLNERLENVIRAFSQTF